MDIVVSCLSRLETAFEGNNSKDFNELIPMIRCEISFLLRNREEKIENLEKEILEVKKELEEKNEKLTKLHLQKRTVEIENQAMKYVLHIEGVQVHGIDKLKVDPEENLEIRVQKDEIAISRNGPGRKELLKQLENKNVQIQDYQDTITVMSHDLEACNKEIDNLKELVDVYQGTRKTMEKEIERLKALSPDPNLTATIILLKQEKAKMEENLNKTRLLYNKLEEDHVKIDQTMFQTFTENIQLTEDNEKLKDLVARKELEAANLFRILKEERKK